MTEVDIRPISLGDAEPLARHFRPPESQHLGREREQQADRAVYRYATIGHERCHYFLKHLP